MDSDEINLKDYDGDDKAPDDFITMAHGFVSKGNLKLIFAVFLIFLFVSSDVFIDRILGRFSSAVEHKIPTTRGTVIQGLFAVLLYVVVDILIRYDVL